MIALAKPLGMTEAEILKRLPFARGQQYLCALALNNGASPVCADEQETAEETTEYARGILMAALRREVLWETMQAA